MVVLPKNGPGMTVVDDNGFQSDILSMRDQFPRSQKHRSTIGSLNKPVKTAHRSTLGSKRQEEKPEAGTFEDYLNKRA